jgi:ribosomal protein L37AE/L43A
MRRTQATRAAEQAKRKARLAEARAVVAADKCPRCGRPLRRNLALTGWWQCSQYGAEGFRADASQPSCDFQIFAE